MNSHKYFENKDCKYYPCHKLDKMNCLFCYCPLYTIECPFKIKNCENCTFPHLAENYENIIERLTAEYERNH